MVGRIADEDARRGTGGELVAGRVDQVGEASAAEDPQLVVGWLHAEEDGVRRQVPGRTAWAPVDQVGGRGECFGPERQRSCTVD